MPIMLGLPLRYHYVLGEMRQAMDVGQKRNGGWEGIRTPEGSFLP